MFSKNLVNVKRISRLLYKKLFYTGSEGAGPQVQVLRSQLCLEQENEEVHQVDHSSSSKVVI